MPCPICLKQMTFFERYPMKVCPECYADEARFGGIVVSIKNLKIINT